MYDMRKLQNKRNPVDFIRDLGYADDCALVSHSQEELQHFITRANEATQKYGLTISVKKTEVLHQKPNSEMKKDEKDLIFKLNDNDIKITNQFIYLGSTLTNEVTLDQEISLRLQKAGTAFGKLWYRVWQPVDIPMSTKMDIYRSCILSILLYGCETWNAYEKHIRRLETFHHRCLRKILKVKWQEFIPTVDILKRANMPWIETLICQARLKWLGHVRRMPDYRYPKRIMISELMEGKRNRSGPLQRWKDVVKKDMGKFHIDNKRWWINSMERSQ